MCLGRRTVTGMLATCGLLFRDWSASYRVFSRERFDAHATFRGVRQHVLEQLPPGAPLCVALDDTLLHKHGRKTHGVAWRRDPLGPPFQTNLVRAQRFVQLSAALPGSQELEGPRMIPIGFAHAPTPPKPTKTASDQQRAAYREQSRAARLPSVATRQLQQLEQEIKDHRGERPVRVVVDGGYTNRTVLRGLPTSFTLIGRIRKDAKLCWLPEDANRATRGRRLRYGAPAPTPDQLREDESVGWRTIPVVAAGKRHECRVKTIGPVLWRTAGADRQLRVIVIAPIAYRKTTAGKTLYRSPAFLICTDPALPVEQVVQHYFWRWDIEVNFREEKTVLGVGQAQVRHAASTQGVPAMVVAAYAVLLLAAARCAAHSCDHSLPLPKWRKPSTCGRVSTQRLIHRMRGELWGRSLGLDADHFSDFATTAHAHSKPQKFAPSLSTAVLYCNP